MPDTKSYGREEVLAKMGRGRNIPPTSRLGEELEFVGFYDALAYIDRLTTPEDTTQDTAPSGSVEEALEHAELCFLCDGCTVDKPVCKTAADCRQHITIATLRNALSQPSEREALGLACTDERCGCDGSAPCGETDLDCCVPAVRVKCAECFRRGTDDCLYAGEGVVDDQCWFATRYASRPANTEREALLERALELAIAAGDFPTLSAQVLMDVAKHNTGHPDDLRGMRWGYKQHYLTQARKEVE